MLLDAWKSLDLHVITMNVIVVSYLLAVELYLDVDFVMMNVQFYPHQSMESKQMADLKVKPHIELQVFHLASLDLKNQNTIQLIVLQSEKLSVVNVSPDKAPKLMNVEIAGCVLENIIAQLVTYGWAIKTNHTIVTLVASVVLAAVRILNIVTAAICVLTLNYTKPTIAM